MHNGAILVRRWVRIGVAVLWGACALSAWSGPYEDGLSAKARGDYAQAVQLLRPLANQGDARCQFEMSLLSHNGQGVAANARESLRWLRLAAHGGHAPAQSNLGAAYAKGRVVPQDMGLAYVWLSAGAANGSREAATNLDVISRRMSPTQISSAKEQATACAQRHFQGCD